MAKDHDLSISQVGNGKHKPSCSCGWEGKRMHNQQAAKAAWERHAQESAGKES